MSRLNRAVIHNECQCLAWYALFNLEYKCHVVNIQRLAYSEVNIPWEWQDTENIDFRLATQENRLNGMLGIKEIRIKLGIKEHYRLTTGQGSKDNQD